MAESHIQRRIRRALEKECGGCFYKQHGNEFTVVGCPDLLGTIQGYFFAFEVKKDGEEPTAAQEYEMARIRAAGGFATWVTSVEEALSFVKKSLARKR